MVKWFLTIQLKGKEYTNNFIEEFKMFDMDQIKKNVVKWGKTDEESGSKSEALAGSSVKPTQQYAKSKQPATIGSSIYFKGELSGEEDFVIQGKVDGEITLKSNNLTVGVDGIINANITANVIIIEGTLKGDMFGNEKVIIRKTGNVLGNIVSPRVTLEDGAKFKGSIEMEPKLKEQGKPENSFNQQNTSQDNKTDFKQASH